MAQGKRPLLDIGGQRFGRLVAETLFGRDDHGNAIWSCRCDCGASKNIRAMSLRAGDTTSCGCLATEAHSAAAKDRFRTHGMRRTPEYAAWKDMRRRCTKPNCKSFKNYGARGIQVCERWQKFENFIADMGVRPSPDHSIDRINNDGGYEPGNCRWATVSEQNFNKRPSRQRKAEARA